jgi:plasmid stabilization system protein ParE
VNSFRKCRHVPGRPHLQWKMIRRRSSGNGHVAVFRVVGETIRVLHVFHTSQDWLSKLKTES